MTGFRLPLALSLAAHAIVLALLLLLPAPAPPAAPPLANNGIEVAFAPSLPQPATTPTSQPVKAEPVPPSPPPPTEPPPPPQLPPPPAAAIEPPPPAPEASVVMPEPLPLPPPPKPPVPPRREVVRRTERPVQRLERPHPAFASVPPPSVEPALPAVPYRQQTIAPARQAALAPARTRPPAPVSPGYATLLGEWMNSHKRYPESAREHGEQGRAVLHFVVERSGRVTEFAVIKSSGYPDLDAGIEEMMRGATLPPFPADMPQSSISVSLSIRFSLEQ